MRDPLERVSVRVKLAVMFVSICLLAFGVGGWIVSRSSKSFLEREIHQRLRLQSRAFAVALENEVRSLERRTEDFASDGHIRRLFADLLATQENVAGAETQRELLRHLRENKLPLVDAFTELVLTGSDGRVIVQTSESADEAVAAVAREACRKEKSWRSALVTRSRTPSHPEFAIATPIRSLDGKTVLGRLLSFVHPGIWAATALDAAGFREEPDEDLVEISLEDQAGRVLGLPHALVGGLPSAADSELVRSGFGLHLDPSRTPNPRASRHPIAASGWAACVHRSEARDLSVIDGLQSRFLAVGLALTLLSGLLLFFPLRFLAQPLARLQHAASRLREGDHSVRVNVESRDEIGALATSFNHMAAAIEERTRRLETAAVDLRAQKAELRRESARLNAVISSMHDGLLVIDQDGTPVVRNAAARPLLALLETEATRVQSHHPCREMTPETACANCLFESDGPPRACRIDVGRSVFEIRSTPLAPTEGERSGRVLVARDITDRVAGEERQVHQERLAVLGEVASVMAHELNNPLAAISMFAQMTEAELPADSPHREGLAVIRRNTESCKRTIRELLDYATDTSPENLPVDVHAVIDDVARFLRPVRERAAIALEIRATAAEAIVVGDEVQLRQVFVNLLVNAFQALGGRPGEVTVQTRNRDQHLEVEIHDEGPGVPADLREAIFKPFFTTKPRGVGTGLGLPTARRIAEMHGGGLELVPDVPVGATFRVKLRVQPREREV